MKKLRILIVGAGVAGKELVSEITNHKELLLEPVGFIDDDISKQNKQIKGIPVLGKRDSLERFIKQLKIEKVFIALPSIDGDIISDVLKRCIKAGITCQTIPRVKEIITGHIDIKRIRDVRIEDLLGRPVRKPDIKEVATLIKGKVVLVTGAAGSIGSELCRQIASYKPSKLVILDWWENGLYELGIEFREQYPEVSLAQVVGNIQDKRRVDTIFQKYAPNIVFHAAAYKHVPLMEDNPIEAVKNNIFGTYNVVQASIQYHVSKFMFISSDKAADAKSVMGRTKKIGEILVSSLNSYNKTVFIATRFGNVLDSYGSILPLFRKQIEKSGPITITSTKMERYFMTIPEACQLILKAAVLGKRNDIFILDMGEQIKIIDLAKKFILLSGLLPEKDIEIKIIGKRRGEKIKEVLASKNEKLVNTKYKEIFRIKNRYLHYSFVKSFITELETSTTSCDEKSLIMKLKSFTEELDHVSYKKKNQAPPYLT